MQLMPPTAQCTLLGGGQAHPALPTHPTSHSCQPACRRARPPLRFPQGFLTSDYSKRDEFSLTIRSEQYHQQIKVG